LNVWKPVKQRGLSVCGSRTSPSSTFVSFFQTVFSLVKQDAKTVSADKMDAPLNLNPSVGYKVTSQKIFNWIKVVVANWTRDIFSIQFMIWIRLSGIYLSLKREWEKSETDCLQDLFKIAKIVKKVFLFQALPPRFNVTS
jgi:hypothetical protein